MVVVYTILTKERRDLTVWCQVEYYVDGNMFILNVPTYNPQTDQDVYDAIYNAGVAHQNAILEQERIDTEILPNLSL